MLPYIRYIISLLNQFMLIENILFFATKIYNNLRLCNLLVIKRIITQGRDFVLCLNKKILNLKKTFITTVLIKKIDVAL